MTTMQLDRIKALVHIARLDSEDQRPPGFLGWDQESWLGIELEADGEEEMGIKVCTSTGCIAGLAALNAGAKVLIHTQPAGYGPRQLVDSEYVLWQDRPILVNHLARDLLGLDDAQASTLFNGDNDIDRLEFIVHEWAHGNVEYDPDWHNEQHADCKQGPRHDDDETLNRLMKEFYAPVKANLVGVEW